MRRGRAILASAVFSSGFISVAACGSQPPANGAASVPAAARSVSTGEFRAIMQAIADGWNEGDSRKSVGYFTENAIYMEPPDAQSYEGHEALFEAFGGKDQPRSPGRMTWHHLLFDETEQIGAGEYTYQGQRRYHGIVIVRLKSGKIDRWREYQRASILDWGDFVGKGRF